MAPAGGPRRRPTSCPTRTRRSLLAAARAGPDIGDRMTDSAAPGPSASACIPNIGPRGRRLRYILAALALVLALIGAARVVLMPLPPLAMIGPALAFFAAALCFFQAREKT